MRKYERVLVTGAGGLIGGAVKRLFPHKYMFLDRGSCDLRDPIAVKKIFDDLKPDCVVNLAASVGGVLSNSRYPQKYFVDNMEIALNVYDACKNVGAKKVVSFLSTCIFPEKACYPLTSVQLHNGPPHPSNFGYAYAKRMIEVLGRSYETQYDLKSTFLIPTNVYGINDNFSIDEGHVLPALLHKIIKAKFYSEDFVVWGSGKPLREFVYVDDIARLIDWSIDNYDCSDPLILSSGKEYSISEAVQTIASITGYSGEVIYDKNKPDGQFRKPSDSDTLKALVPSFQWTPLHDGIGKTFKWLESVNFKARGF